MRVKQEEQERKKKMGVARSLAMVLMIMAMCLAATGSSQHEDNADGLRLPSQGVGVGGSSGKPWSCCDNCMCSRSIPPICTCHDTLVGGCDAKCKNCEQLPQLIYPPFFVCRDTIRDYCGDSCHPDPLHLN